MSTISQPPRPAAAPESRGWTVQLRIPEMWASLAIVAMWAVVAVSAVWGPDFVSTSAGQNSTRIPAGIAVAVFACVGTWAVAKHGFGRGRKET
jgi:hypothetical protein